MQLAIRLESFYSEGDERRFFEGLADIACISNVRGVVRDLVFDLHTGRLGQEALRELIALLWRYGISLVPLAVLADKPRFAWLRDPRWYWSSSMFPAMQGTGTKAYRTDQ